MRVDEDITRDVVESLYWDTRVDASNITVAAKDGEVVLGGTVPTYRARWAAEEDARVIRGVTQLRNDVAVRYPATVSVPSDSDILDDIRRDLLLDPDIDDADIQITVNDGWVTLRGSVPSLWEKDLAGEVASTSRGVLGIDNDIAVVPTRSKVDEVIADDIIAELDRRALVDPGDIDVTVADGHVTLLGTVPTWRARQAVHHAARYTLGVVAVIDNLVVTGT